MRWVVFVLITASFAGCTGPGALSGEIVITTTVVDEGGEPIRGARVVVTYGVEEARREVRTGADGIAQVALPNSFVKPAVHTGPGGEQGYTWDLAIWASAAGYPAKQAWITEAYLSAEHSELKAAVSLSPTARRG